MKERLDSWKEIATYLGRDVRTVQRWERSEGLPVERHFHGERATVYAFPEKVDAWLAGRNADAAGGSRGHLTSIWRPWSALIAAAFLIMIALAWPSNERRHVAQSRALTRLSMSLSETTLESGIPIGLAISPDGRHIVYRSGRGRRTQLCLRSFDSPGAVAIPGTEGVEGFPFFAPDGLSLGFFVKGELKRTSLDGRTQILICEVGPRWYGGSWDARGNIVFAGSPRDGVEGLYLVSQLGGVPELLAAPQAEEGVRYYSYPRFLPGGKALLFDASCEVDGNKSTEVRVLLLETGEQKKLVSGFGSYYSPSGHLLYQSRQSLLAAPFDVRRLEVTGEAVPVLEPVSRRDYVLAPNGTLAYLPGRDNFLMVWVHPDGAEQTLERLPRQPLNPRISPDGRQVAVQFLDPHSSQVWLYDLENSSQRRLTNGEPWNAVPVWTPDSKWVTFASADRAYSLEGPFRLCRMRTDGRGDIEFLTASPFPLSPAAWSPDGKDLAVMELRMGDWHVSTLAQQGQSPRTSSHSSGRESSPRFSPNGRWLAYISWDKARNASIFVRECAHPETEWPVLTGPGLKTNAVRWSPDGKEIFYYDFGEKKMMAVSVRTQPTFQTTSPRMLFEGKAYYGGFDLSPDGGRFLMLRRDTPPALLEVVLNWFQELDTLVPLEQTG